MLIRKHVCLNFQVGQLARERLDVPDDELSIPSDSRDGVDIVFATIVNTKLGYLELFRLEKCSPFKIVVHINGVVIWGRIFIQYLVLVGCVELGLQFAGAQLVLVLEELLGPHCCRGLLLLVLLEPGAKGEGAAGVQVEGDGNTVVTGRHDGPGESIGYVTGQDNVGVCIYLSVIQVRVSRGSRSVLSFITIMSLVASATEMELSCPTQASLDPSPEKLTAWTQPPPLAELENSVMRLPMGILAPQAVAEGFGSISLMKPE